jgi:hypothetical protein
MRSLICGSASPFSYWHLRHHQSGFAQVAKELAATEKARIVALVKKAVS